MALVGGGHNGTMAEWIMFLHAPRENFAETMTEEEIEVWGVHFERYVRLLAEGKVILAGPTLGPINTGIFIFEAPDEDGHYLFVRWLQLERRLPVQNPDTSGPRGHHPPLYHLIAAALSAGVRAGTDTDFIAMAVNPKIAFRYDDPERDNKNLWVHYGPEERWPFSGQARIVHIGRDMIRSLAGGAAVKKGEVR